MSSQKKRVVYLLGAGASQGEISEGGSAKRILMSDIATGMSLKIKRKNIKLLWEVNNELSTPGIDVEHLITLYEASGSKIHGKIARELKKLFREEIQERIEELGESFFPNLLTSLIDMHSVQGLNEELIAILTLNYEDLIERAMQFAKGTVNYAIKVTSKHRSYAVQTDNILPVLKLHGSFNWKNEYPVTIVNKIRNEEDVLWIPPGVIKRRENYPFSLIWSRARELLECDVLRIIGCSLSRNDWELISLLYITQKLRSDRKQYLIELIDYPKQCDEIKDRYRYLNMTSVLDIPEVRDYLIAEYFPTWADKKYTPLSILEELKDNITSDKNNIFAIWLRSKGDYLLRNGILLTTSKNFFEKFVKLGLGHEKA